MRRLFAISVLFIVAFYSNVSATTWHVMPDSTGDVINFQAAIDSASAGDTIMAMTGNYWGPGFRELVVDSKALVFNTDGGLVSLDCDTDRDIPTGTFYKAFTFNNVTEGEFLFDGYSVYGGNGVFECNNSNVRITHSRFSSYCSPPDCYGGVFIYADSSTVYMNDIDFSQLVALSSSHSNIYISYCTTNGNISNSYIFNQSRIVMENSSIVNCRPRGNATGGPGITCGSSYLKMDNVSIMDNVSVEWLHILNFNGPQDTLLIRNSSFQNNGSSTHGGGAMINIDCHYAYIENTKIIDNSHAGSVFSLTTSNMADIVYSVFDGNSGSFFEIFSFTCNNLNISNSLITNNMNTGATLVANSTLTFNNVDYIGNHGISCDTLYTNSSIFAFNEKLYSLFGDNWINGVFADFKNCDVYGNEDGDWVNVIDNQDTIPGNISLDPLFCDIASGKYSLYANSPCLPGNHPDGPDCGLIGAYGLGCPYNEPYLSLIKDVGNDQGREVSVSWYRSHYDSSGSTQPIYNYEIYRRIDDLPSPPLAMAEGLDSPDDAGESRQVLAYPDGDWHFLTEVPAHGEDIYHVVVPTLEDSCVYNDSTVTGDPLYYSTFFIRAATSVPTTFFDSAPDSGYSVDNLAPAPPLGLAVSYNTGSGNQLNWDTSPEPDFQYYRIYRGTDESFIPGPGNLIQETASPSWTDPDNDGSDVYYKVTALDYAENESDTASPATTTGDDLPAVPDEFTLYQNVPNPFNPATTIRFDLPRATHVKLSVYNVKGELVTTLVNRQMSVGRKEVNWTAKDNKGRVVTSSVYFYRLVADDFVQTRKMVLLK